MARPATPDVKITESLQPVATPLGLYDRPAMPEKSPLHGVASALESLSGDLASWGNKQAEKAKQEDAIRGEASFWQENSQGAAEGVRTGEIPANKSPEFINGYKRAAGSAAGFQLESDVSAAYDKWPGKTVDDPQAFDSWFRETVKGKVATDDPNVLKGLLPHLREIQNKFHDRWQKEVTLNTQYTALSSYGALAATTIDAYNREGLANRTGTDINTLGASLDEIRQRGFATGLRREQIDQALTDAITTRALVHRDPKLLELLDRQSAGGPKLGDTPYGRDQKTKTIDSLTSLWKTQETEARLKQDREDKLLANKAKASIVEQILKDPDAPLDEAQIANVTKVDGDFKLDIIKWRGTVRDNQVTDDPKKVGQLYTDILSGGDGMEKLMSAIRSGDVKSKESIAQGLTFVKTAGEYGQRADGILGTASAKSYLGQLQTMGQDSAFSTGRLLGDAPVLTPDGREALNRYRFDLMQWQTQNPSASPLEREEYATRLGEAIMKNFQRAPAAMERRFTPPPSSSPAEPTRQDTGQTATSPTLRTQTTPPASSPASTQPSILDSIEPSAKTRIEEMATRKGVRPDDIVRDLQSRGVNIPRSEAPSLVPAPGNSPAAPSAPAMGPRTDVPSIQLPGGLGQVQLVGMSPRHEELIRSAVQGLNLTGWSQQASRPSPQDQGEGEVMGRLSSKYESRGSSASIGYDATGGWSYGKYQFAAGGSVADGSAMRTFIRTLPQDLQSKLEEAGGAGAAREGTAEFKAAWREASQDPRFSQAEASVVSKTFLQPAMRGVQQATGLDVAGRSAVLQDVLWSVAVQHGAGGARRLFANALSGQDVSSMSDQDIIRAVYAERRKVDTYFASSTDAVKESVHRRFFHEERDALRMLSDSGRG